MSRHRAPVRPRYGRLAVLGASLTVTAVAVVGAVAGFPGTSGGPAAAKIDPQSTQSTAGPSPSSTPESTPASTPSSTSSLTTTESEEPVDETALPEGSGTGKRIVFDQSDQRVWLVDTATDVRRTYLVSGSTLDNLDPGTYSVYSKSRWAVGIDDSGVMQYFVRFTQGPSGAAIGFHTIPTKDGTPLQTRQQLGTPQSHGCIRQKTPDAIALWDFAPVGTKVVVTA